MRRPQARRAARRVAHGRQQNPPRGPRRRIQFRDDPGRLPPELAAIATSLAIESGQPVPRPLAFARLLESLEDWLALHDLEGFGPVRERFLELSSTLGERVRAEVGETGGVSRAVEGEAVDLAEDGALVVRRENGELVRVVAGEVEHCRTV
ncbi:MAG: biotin--[acetyl-CoA-carboxylase] ligase [Myxococcales bacterium]